MSTTLTGDATAADLYLSRTVTGATNASPIVITTSASHLFATGDRVVVASVGGNTAANGEFTITKLSATTFSLDGSTGNGAYTSGGTAACITATPQFTIPADGDTLDAASVNVALEALADRTQALALAVRNRVDEFTANGTWTAPDNCFAVELEGCGGGGGGGGATPAGTVNTESATGGAGGGGAQLGRRIVAVTPGTSYTVTIGAGGTGGAASTAGGAGGDTTFGALATFAGAGGGTSSSSSSSNTARATLGGLPVANVSANYNGRIAFPTNASDLVIPAAGAGGSGVNAIGGFTTGYAGNESTEGYAGGAGAASGATGATYLGGGGGGGGGGGPYGVGGAGGAGGDGPDLPGTNGTAAAANTGGGGGGGGGAGQWSTPTAAAGTGGAGGSGRLKVFYVGPKATVT